MIREIRIDDALWASAPKLRRDDWRVSIVDLVDDARLGDDGDRVVHFSYDANAVRCRTFGERGEPRASFEVTAAQLRLHVEEYLAIVRKMHASGDASDFSSRMAAFDMAKKVVHDGAAKTLASAMPGLARDHETYRRLFSLIFSLIVDVTKLPTARAHRRHA